MRERVCAILFRPVFVVEAVADGAHGIADFDAVGGISQCIEHFRFSYLRGSQRPDGAASMTASVCSPRLGARERTVAGVLLNSIGNRATFMWPSVGWSTS